MKQPENAPKQRRFIDEKELAEITSIHRRTWQKYRLYGKPPKFYKINGNVRYDLDEVLAWIESKAVEGKRR